jgi:hypothetical protein
MQAVFYSLDGYPVSVNISHIESVEWGSEEGDPTQIYLISGRFYQLSHFNKRNHPLLELIGGKDWIKFTEEIEE